MDGKLTIAHWSEDDQPREKLRDKGPQTLSNAELLAILIGSGTPGVSAVELMQNVLKDCNNNLNTLGKMSIRELCEYKGVGEAKAITILAACELGKRTTGFGDSHAHLQPHAPAIARLRRGGVLAYALEPELPTYQEGTHLTWRHYRGSR